MEMHLKGAKVVGQDKDTSIVYGMPKAAFDLGVVDVQAPLGSVAEQVLKYCAG
jgi:two-component system chemotaxis response regulator CheB